MKGKRSLTLLLLAGGLLLAHQLGYIDTGQLAATDAGAATVTRPASVDEADEGAELIAEAFAAERSGFMVQTRGVVDRVLADDDDGSRHQRFVLLLANRHTVLVAHNIDLAERVPLEKGDEVELKGQYEWNERGGVLHWTHHDPAGRHEEGWIRLAGKVYE